MKKILAAGLVAVAGLSASNVMAASQTTDLTVTATVNGSCRFNSAGPTALAFGTINQTSGTNATATANVTFRCTKGTSSSIASEIGINDLTGAHRVKANTADFMAYTVAYGGTNVQVGTGHGAGQDKTLIVSGAIVPAEFQNAAAGSYTDTLTLTIAP